MRIKYYIYIWNGVICVVEMYVCPPFETLLPSAAWCVYGPLRVFVVYISKGMEKSNVRVSREWYQSKSQWNGWMGKQKEEEKKKRKIVQRKKKKESIVRRTPFSPKDFFSPSSWEIWDTFLLLRTLSHLI